MYRLVKCAELFSRLSIFVQYVRDVLTQKVIMPPLSPDESPGFLLAQVCRLHHTRAQAMLEALGLYRGQPPVLHFLHEEDGLTHSALAVRLNVTPATVTKMLQRMENAGWVIRRPDAVDQRVSPD